MRFRSLICSVHGKDKDQEKKTVKCVILFAVAVVLIVIAVVFFRKGTDGRKQ